MTQEQFFKRYTYNVSTDKLGGGAFGTVYKAYDNVLDKQVAIKIAEVKEVGGKTFSLLDEFEALQGLSAHRNIANYEQVYTFQQQNGVFDYAIIQYYPHGNLKALQENNNLSTVEKETIATQLLEGIEFLHNNRVIHRDLKPSNILVHRRNNGQYIPKIADFGLSKKTSSERMTNSFAGGTVEFSSPEQLKGKRIKLNTDLWSFGVIAYELFTGKRLFVTNSTDATGEQNQQLFNQIFDKDVTEKLQDPRIPATWRTILTKCLQKDNHQRVETATELLALLKGANANVQDDATIIQTVVQPKQAPQSTKKVKKQTKTSQQTSKKHKQKKNPKWIIPTAIVSILFSIWIFASTILKKTNQPQVEEAPKVEDIVLSKDRKFPFSPKDVLVRKYGNQYRLAQKSDFNWSVEEVEGVIEMQKTTPDYPFIAKGDFNNDSKIDYAFVVQNQQTNRNEIFIYNPDFEYGFMPDLKGITTFDAISKEAKSNILNPKTQMYISLLSDGIMLEDFDGGSHILHWNGTTYQLDNIGF